MAERKPVRRSCLSERLLHADFVKENSNGLYPRRDICRQETFKSQGKQWSSKRTSSIDVGNELQAILSCKPCEDISPVFGCSPPARSSNPLSRDYQFRSCVLVNPNLSAGNSMKEIIEIYAAVMPDI